VLETRQVLEPVQEGVQQADAALHIAVFPCYCVEVHVCLLDHIGLGVAQAARVLDLDLAKVGQDPLGDLGPLVGCKDLLLLHLLSPVLLVLLFGVSLNSVNGLEEFSGGEGIVDH